jgi:hypothetical protein
MREELKTVGITKKRLAAELLKELEAVETKVVKVKGFMIPGMAGVDSEMKETLPDGYSAVFKTTDETLVQRDLVDWDIRQRARMDAQKLLGAYPANKLEISAPSELVRDVVEEIGQEPDVKLPSQEPDE